MIGIRSFVLYNFYSLESHCKFCDERIGGEEKNKNFPNPIGAGRGFTPGPDSGNAGISPAGNISAIDGLAIRDPSKGKT